MARLHDLAARLFRRPTRPVRSVPLTLQALESRDVPATWYSVHLDSPAQGVHGSSALTVTGGGLAVLPQYDPDGDGTALVPAESAADAVRLAVGGTVSLGRTSFALTPATSSEYTDEAVPFGVGADGSGAAIWLEDLANDPTNSDWDYNDTSWAVSVTDAVPQPAAVWFEQTGPDETRLDTPPTQTLDRGSDPVAVVLRRSGDLSAPLTVNLTPAATNTSRTGDSGAQGGPAYGPNGDYVLSADGVDLPTPEATFAAGKDIITLELRTPPAGTPTGPAIQTLELRTPPAGTRTGPDSVILLNRIPPADYAAQPTRAMLLIGGTPPTKPATPPAKPQDTAKLDEAALDKVIADHIFKIEVLRLRVLHGTGDKAGKTEIIIRGGHHKDSVPAPGVEVEISDANKPKVKVPVDMKPVSTPADVTLHKDKPYKIEYQPVVTGRVIIGEGSKAEDQKNARTKSCFPDSRDAAKVKATAIQALKQAREAKPGDMDNRFVTNNAPDTSNGSFFAVIDGQKYSGYWRYDATTNQIKITSFFPVV